MHTKIKLLCAFLLIITTTFLDLHALSGIFVVLVLLSRLKKMDVRTLRYPLFIAIVVAGVQMYDSGIGRALLVFLRILDSVLILNILISSVSHDEIISSLRGWVPSTILGIARLMLRYTSILEEEASTIYKAQWARGGYSGGLMKRAKNYGTLGGMIVLRSLNRSLLVYKAMLSRGYNED